MGKRGGQEFEFIQSTYSINWYNELISLDKSNLGTI